MAMARTKVKTDELEAVLGTRLRALRVAGRLTQAELADRANISVGAVKHLESGAGATVTTLVRVLRALGQDDWVDTLGPAPTSFNPLDLLEASDRSRRPPAQRVRHRRAPG